MIKASLASEQEPQYHFNGIVKDKAIKSGLIYGNKVIEHIESGKFISRYQTIVHPQNRGIL
jgi:hypothetical protein